MLMKRLLALVMVSVSGAIFAASCAEPVDVEGPTPTAADDEAVGQARDELVKIIRCTGDELGAACERKCDAAGVWCPSRYTHPYKPDAGDGELFQCRQVLAAQSCWYYYESNQDKCVRATGLGRVVTLCSYEGSRP
jgi:hypothetical protein